MTDGDRVEHDSMGEVHVPAGARWGATTQRAIENFPISGQRIDPELIHALGRIKAAAASANAALGVLDAETAAAIRTAALEVADGGWDDHFPIDVYQTGSGTSSNMNANEVIANVAGERLGRPVHPNDKVNASQSSNDVFPSAIHLAATDGVVNDAHPRPAPTGGGARGQGGRVRRRREVRPHAPDGCNAGDPGAGVLRLRSAGPLRNRAARVDPPEGRRACPGRHRGRHRDQRPGWLRGGGHRGAGILHRAAAHRGAQPLRGAGRPRRAGRAERAAADRSPSASTRSRRTSAGWAPGRAPAWRRSTCPISSRARRSCPAR